MSEVFGVYCYAMYSLIGGIAYAFHAHRDTWYSAPMCQINWWIPIFEVNGGNAEVVAAQSAVEEVRERWGIEVYALATLDDLLGHLESDARPSSAGKGQFMKFFT